MTHPYLRQRWWAGLAVALAGVVIIVSFAVIVAAWTFMASFF